MDNRLLAFYRSSDIKTDESEHLLVLRETCAVLEEQVQVILDRVSDSDRQVLLAYMDLRDELEIETVKVALCCGSKIVL